MKKLQDKLVLITGGSTGMGLASAQEFAREGARVAICGRNADSLAKAATSIEGDVLTIQADVSRLTDIDRMFATIEAEFGHLEVLFSNAGWTDFAPFLEVTEQSFDDQVAANLKATFFTIQKAVPLLRQGASVLINASVVANKGWPRTSVVAAIKAGQRNLARTISGELMDRGIRVNAISPGPIDDEFFARHSDDDGASKKEYHLKVNPSKRLGTVEEVAKLALFLASDDSAWIIGADYGIDGGAANLP